MTDIHATAPGQPPGRARRLLLQCSITALLAVGVLASRGCGQPAPDGSWTTMTGPYPQMLFSVWGTSRNDLWAVGGKNVTVGCDAGMCEGDPSPMILRFDGSTWREVQSPRASILWWVFGFSASDVWIAGERGVMLHWDGTRIVDVPTDAARNVKLFGVWGAAPNDVWAVGGVPDGSSAVLHWNGTTVSTVKDVPQVSDKVGGAWYKVWGSAADDVYLVGQSGALVHWDGKAWTRIDLSSAGVTREPLFTVAGAGKKDVYVVGGIGQGVALHYDGVAWTRVAGLKLDTTAGLTGVCETAAGDVAITGMSGAKFVGRLGSFRDDSSLKPRDDLHAVWMQSPDDIFAAGGNFFAVRDGIIAHYGK